MIRTDRPSKSAIKTGRTGPFIWVFGVDSRGARVTASRERHPSILIDAPAELRFVLSKELLEPPVYSIFSAAHPGFLYSLGASSVGNIVEGHHYSVGRSFKFLRHENREPVDFGAAALIKDMSDDRVAFHEDQAIVAQREKDADEDRGREPAQPAHLRGEMASRIRVIDPPGKILLERRRLPIRAGQKGSGHGCHSDRSFGDDLARKPPQR